MNDWRGRDGLDRLLAALDADAGATRFVGGVVRDTLLGLPTKDIDLATRLRPEEVVTRVRDAGLKPVPTGIAHGTVTAVLPGGPVEVTTLRRDLSTDGRHATVAFGEDWRADAARRDFTINALSAGPAFGRDADVEIHDYFGGRDDLAARRVRFIGDPHVRIAEDHLRILRFFRFHARFGAAAPNADGLAACAARANDLMALSRERIADELLKLLGVDDPTPTVALMIAHVILAPVLPEVDADGAARLDELVAREALAGVAGEPLRRLAALLPADPALADEVAARLRLSNVARKRLVAAADRLPPADARGAAYRLGPQGATDLLLLRQPDDRLRGKALASLAGWERPRLGFSGGEIVACGIRAGPLVAATLQAIERRWIAEGFPDAVRVRAIADEEIAQAVSAHQ